MEDREMVGFIEGVEAVYKRRTATRAAWAAEREAVTLVLPRLIEDLSPVYDIQEAIAVGGGGIIIKVLDRSLSVKRALKVARPSPGRERFLADALQSESDKLVRLSHPNLMPVFAVGVAEAGAIALPYYVMPFLEGSHDLAVGFASEGLALSGSAVVDALAKMVGVVTYLHSNGVIHMDIKPANIIIDDRDEPLLSDLGFAKEVSATSAGLTSAAGTSGFGHPEFMEMLDQAASDSNRVTGAVERRTIAKRGEIWDIYSLGKTIDSVLSASNVQSALSSYQFRFLKLMATRMLDGNVSKPLLGLGLRALEELSYISMSDVSDDLDRLTGGVDILEAVPELNVFSIDTVQISTLSTTPFTERVQSIADTPSVSRLNQVMQLGLLNLIYPTATHSRYEHAIGTYSATARYLTALYRDPLNPVFRQIMRPRDIEAALLAALLHDIGHYPLAHDFEEAVPHYFSHEDYGDELTENDPDLADLIAASWNATMDDVQAVLRASTTSMEGLLRNRILKSIIDGPIDADKLDYLMRDSQRLGLSVGLGIDVERLLRTLTVVLRSAPDDATFGAVGIHEKGKVTAEALAFARYTLYGSAYWHHSYRAIKAMLHYVIWEWLSYSKDVDASVADFKQFVGVHDPERLQLEADFPALSSAFIPQQERNVLGWMAAQTPQNPTVRTVVERLANRSLAKRLAVWSKGVRGEKDVWGRYKQFVEEAAQSREGWRKRRGLRMAVQSEVLTALSSVKPNIAAKVSDLANQEPIIFIDIPAPKRASAGALEYVFEGTRSEYRSSRDVANPKIEESLVWKTLNDQLNDSLANLRLFAHPDVARGLREHLSAETLEGCLDRALHSNLARKGK